MKPLNEEDLHWFIKWIFMRRNYINAQEKINQLETEIKDLKSKLDEISVKIRQPEVKQKHKKPKFEIDKTLWKKHLV